MGEAGLVLPDIFWEIHSGLPREGPGDNASTRRAFEMAAGLPPNPRILDIGCGPGMQTLELATISRGFVAALDLHRPFLSNVIDRASAAGLAAQIATVNASMVRLPFADASFDLIWCEGAMYFMGFREGLAAWKGLLRPNGYISVTEPCWLKPDLPQEVKDLFAEYPAMTYAENWLSVISESGYQTIGRFTLPEASWWDEYYTPMTEQLARMRERHRADQAALSVIDEHDREIEAYRKYSAYYGYVFFVMRLV